MFNCCNALTSSFKLSLQSNSKQLSARYYLSTDAIFWDNSCGDIDMCQCGRHGYSFTVVKVPELIVSDAGIMLLNFGLYQCKIHIAGPKMFKNVQSHLMYICMSGVRQVAAPCNVLKFL